MAAHQAGFANVVASLGTALTQGPGRARHPLRRCGRARLRRRPRRRGRHPARPARGARAGPVGEQGARRAHSRRQGSRRADPDRSGGVADGGRRGAAGARLLHGPRRRVGRPVERDRAARGHRAACSASCAGWGIGSSSTLYLQRLSRLVDVDEKVLPDELAATPRPAPRRPVDEAGDERERVSATLPPLERRRCASCSATRPRRRSSATGRSRSARPPPRALARAWAARRRARRTTRPRSRRSSAGSIAATRRAGPRPAGRRARADTSPRPRDRRGARCAPQLPAAAARGARSRTPSATGGSSWTRPTATATRARPHIGRTDDPPRPREGRARHER